MLTKINEFVLRLVARVRSEEGQALAEYGLVIGLVAVVCIAVLTALGLAIFGVLADITAVMP